MMNFQDILLIARELFYCPMCGLKFDAEKISLKAVLGDKLIIHTSCTKGHKPIEVLFISSVDTSNAPLWLKGDPISTDEMLDLKNYLNHFNGDFIAAFENLKPDGKLSA